METEDDMRQQDAEEGMRPAAPDEEEAVPRFFAFDPLEHSETVSREQLSLIMYRGGESK